MKRTETWKKARPEERALWIMGIEPRYWKASLTELAPYGFTVDRKYGKTVTVSKKAQVDIMKKIVETPEYLRYPTVVGIGSTPTEGYGMACAAAIAKIAVKNGLQVAVLDLGNMPDRQSNLDRYNRIKDADVVIIHNISKESTPQRIQDARDWIKESCDRFCVYVVAGTDPLSFADIKLRRPVDACFMFVGNIQKIEEY